MDNYALEFAVTSLLILIPAYTANGFACILGGGRPLDMNKNFIDGKRVLGDGKTVRGMLAGIILGTLSSASAAALLNLLFTQLISRYYVLLGLSVAVGGILGDMLGAFIKRRMNLPRGASAPLLDQLDFILIGFLFAYVFNAFVPLLNITLPVFMIVIVLTPIAHITACHIAYKAGKKREPW